MRCEVCMRSLDNYIDGELPESERCDVEEHIRECSECGGEAKFLRRLCRDAASLPKEIQPGRDLWPGIEAEISTTHRSKSEETAKGEEGLERKSDRVRTHHWGWRIAAAAMLASLLVAGTYLVLRKLDFERARQTTTTDTRKNKSSGIAKPSSTRSPDVQPRVIPQDDTRKLASPDIPTSGGKPPAGILTYLVDSYAGVFVSNYGIYAVHQDLEGPFLAASRDSILRFGQNGTQEWIPPLPPGSTLLSVYPGDGNRLWAAYLVRGIKSQLAIAELDFGIDSQVRIIWTSNDLYIGGFVIGPQGLIYAAGNRNDFGRNVSRLTKGQSITTELIHIIDPRTGKEKDLFPITLRPKFDSPLWAGQTTLEMTSLVSETVISVKSNGNFFVTIDRTAALASVRGLIKNEAVEYTPDGKVAKRWELGNLEPDAYLNKIFVDVDDSILAEIIRFPDKGITDSVNTTVMDRYLLHMDPNGRVTRSDPDLYSNEGIQGWIGQTREVVTVAREGSMKQIRIFHGF